MRSVATLPEYVTVVAQTFSNCGEFYAAASRSGEVVIWRTSYLTGDEPARPLLKFKHGDGLHSLISIDRYLLAGGEGEVLAWDWENLVRKDASPEWSLRLPVGGRCEVNSMTIESEGSTAGHLVLGCGDKNLQLVDMETRRILRTLTGHTGYVHCVAGGEPGTLVSGGEEGALKLWDTRSSKSETHTLLPAKVPELERPIHGKFVAAVAVSGDLVACAGGPSPSLWHMSSLSMRTQLPGGSGPDHAVVLLPEHVVVGGQGSTLHQANLRGEAVHEEALSSSCTYTILNNNQSGILLAAGASNRISIRSESLQQNHPNLLFPI